MRAVGVSLVVALLGLLATAAGRRRLERRPGPRDGHEYWALGLVALLPAWLVAFLALLPSAPGQRPQLVSGAAWILSTAAALLGAIATESRVRRAAELEDAAAPLRCWQLGVSALIPAWALALLARAAIAAMG
jgi:hypothetical protein